MVVFVKRGVARTNSTMRHTMPYVLVLSAHVLVTGL